MKILLLGGTKDSTNIIEHIKKNSMKKKIVFATGLNFITLID